jgi:hypothetical protein
VPALPDPRFDSADVPFDVLVDAVTARKIHSMASHAERPGDWLVPLAEVEVRWRIRRLRVTLRAEQ